MTTAMKSHSFSSLQIRLGSTFALWLAFSGYASATCSPYPECEADNAPPTVSLTAPGSGASSPAPGAFTLTATASDVDGAISAVEFFSNNVSIGIDSSAPYSMSYGGLSAGSYAIKAKATDDLGATAFSTVVSVTVTAGNAAPSVSLTSPANNSSATAPASIVISASAADSDGSIASVVFKNGTSVINTDTTYPYSYIWTGVGAGSYVISAVATDNAGASSSTPAVTVSVNGSSNVSPSVSLTAPGNGSTANVSTLFTLAANASDTDGGVSNVKFYANGALVATDATAPYSANWSTSTPGSYAIQAIATDSANATAASGSASVTVQVPPSVSETRSYVYDQYHRLCKTINPESGATVIDYDAAGNVWRTADGLNLPSTTQCNRDMVTQWTKRVYDAMDRVMQVITPDGNANVDTTYFPDGQVRSITATNPGGYAVVSSYLYNKRGLLTSEKQTNGNTVYSLDYGYTVNGHLASQTYPDKQVVTYNPDALGRPTSVVSGATTYASSIAYYPNGAMSSFNYGSGVTHTMTQNVRQLPSRSQDIKASAGLVVLDDSYSYDANGNVTDIVDAAQAGAASQTRGMAYDGLDRLTAALGPWGTGTYAYDALDNLRVADQGSRQYRYSYDSNWRLNLIKNAAGATVHTFGYDAQGNQTSKSAQTRLFDSANRLSQVTGAQTYRYDGLGRRVQTTDADNKTTFWLYSQGGQVMYSSEGRRSRNLAYIYLNGSQIATRAVAWAPSNTIAVRYEYTDALGSPVAESNASGAAASITRVSYASWGEATPSVDGAGYTGHVMDAGPGLTYMQQRYYDPQIGRFLSSDPAESEFNRYNYASNNPHRFTDPDGRVAGGAHLCDSPGGCDSGSFGPSISTIAPAAHGGDSTAPEGSRPAAFAAGGAVLGGVVASAASAGCDAATVGICAPANPAIVGAGVAAGAVTGLAIEKAWTQLENLVQKSAVATGPSEYQYALVAARPGLYPNVRGGVSTLAAGDVWKYGTSIDPNGRYPLAGVQGLGLQMVVQTTGNHYQVLAQEKAMLIGYALTHGSLPPGNRIFK